MDLTITISDANALRVAEAFGLTGTNAQKKAQMEAMIKARWKEQVANYEAALDAADTVSAVSAEVW